MPLQLTVPSITAEADATTLLPTRTELFDRIEARSAEGGAPATLVIVGLLRRDTGWPTPASTLAQVAASFARDIRGEDWLARSGPSEFSVLFEGPASGAEIAANRLIAGVIGEKINGLTASAGLAELAPGTSAGEIHRRAQLCLTAARAVGGGQVIRYSGTR